MPIVFSALVPHPPILIPNIGKENIKLLKNTAESYNDLEADLYASQAETIIIISPHGPQQTEAFTMNLAPQFNINFAEFGDLATKFNVAGDLALAYKIREKLETKAPLQLISQIDLDHGCSVPLVMLTKHLPKIKIIPIYYSGLDLAAHYNFGQLLQHEILSTKTRLAVIASGDLSHRLTKNAPAGYSAKGKKFDQKLIELLQANQVETIIKMNLNFVTEAGECGLKSAVILLGILAGLNYQPQMLSYEAPFGVGYLVMKFQF